MNSKLFLAAVMACALVLAVGCSQETITGPEGETSLSENGPAKAADGIVAGRYIVQFSGKAGDPVAKAGDLADKYGFDLGLVYRHAIQGMPVQVSAEVAELLRAEPGVLRVTPDRLLQASVQTLPSGVDRIEVDLNSMADIDGLPTLVDVDIAILDTGIDYNHPDLNVVDGVRIIGGVVAPDFMDDNGHGTHVSGSAAARDNNIGVVGVAPGARLWGVKILDQNGSGWYSDLVGGLDWVAARAADIEVANMSLTGVGWDWPLHDALAACVEAGVVVVVAAGNDDRDVYGFDGRIGTGDDLVPAAFPEAATISALADSDGMPGGTGPFTSFGPDDSFASFSNWSGSVYSGNPVVSPGMAIDIMAPGVDITSTFPGGGYAVYSGTSMASPHAAGLYGLHIAQFGRAVNAAGVYAIRQAVIDLAVPQNSPQGLAVLNDPDGNGDPLGWALDMPTGADVAILSFTAEPPVVDPGGVLMMTVELGNLGSGPSGPFTASIVEPNSGAVLASRSLPGLNAGDIVGGSVHFIVPADKFSAAVAPGLYTLICSHDYPDAQPTNDEIAVTVEVAGGGPTGESIEMYFLDGADLVPCLDVGFTGTATIKIIWHNPSIPATGGIECGWDLSGGAGSYSSLFIKSFPVPGWLDLGLDDVAAGTFNIVCGFPDPLPTTVQTEMASIEVLFFELAPNDMIDVTMRNGIPVSIPGETRPITMSADYLTLYPIDMRHAAGSPSLQFNPAVCGVTYNDGKTIQTVRNLFR